jgi:hypothetical protein
VYEQGAFYVTEDVAGTGVAGPDIGGAQSYDARPGRDGLGFEEPFVLDTTKYRSTFGTATTPLSTAIAETVGWYRSDVGA